jgi:ATP synthase protein I
LGIDLPGAACYTGVPLEPRKRPENPALPWIRRAPEVEVVGPGDRERGPDDEQGLSSLAAGYRKAAPYIAASTSLVAAVGVLTGLGIWLDRKLDTSPWFTLLGVVVGMTGGFISFFKTVLGKR